MAPNEPNTDSSSITLETLGLGGLASASALGITLLDHPVAFIQAVITEMLLGGLFSLFGWFGAQMLMIWELLADVVGDSVDAAIPGATIADIPLDLISSLSDLFTDLAVQLGPLAPFAMIIMWALTVLAAVGLIWLLWLIIKSITTL